MAPLHLRSPIAPLLLLALLGLFAVSLPAAIPPTPPPGEFLHDFAALLTPEQQAGIRAQQQQILQDTGIPIVVVTVSAMRHYISDAPSIEAFARFWFDTWGIGSQRQNSGMLVIVSRDDRRARIELGASWERRWDRYAQAVMNDRMVPRFKTGDYGAGLIAGVDALARMAVAGPASEPPAPNTLEKFMATPFVKFARENNPLTAELGKWTPLALAAGVILAVVGLFVPEHRKTLVGLGLGIVGLILFFWVVVVVIALIKRGTSTSSGSFGSGGGGGGGFGGGSSGGGGASGSW